MFYYSGDAIFFSVDMQSDTSSMVGHIIIIIFPLVDHVKESGR